MASIKLDDGREVQLSAETVERLKKELFPRRFYIGDKFQFGTSHYILSEVGNDLWALINMNTGQRKHYACRLQSRYDPETAKLYVTQLPTASPGDFGNEYVGLGL